MISDFLGFAIGMKNRLADKVTGKLPEPFRTEVSGLRAEAAGRMKELAGLGMELLSRLNESIGGDFEMVDHKPAEAGEKKLKKIELE